MKILYLDQNAASYLAEPPNQQWKQIAQQLEEGFSDRRLVCPIPRETIIETARCSRREKRILIQTFLNSVCGGMRFCSFREIMQSATLALVRPSHDIVPFELIEPNWAEDDVEAARIAKVDGEMRKRMEERVGAFSHSPEQRSYTPGEMFLSGAEERTRKLWRDLDRFLVEPATAIGAYEVPWLMQFLIGAGISADEARALVAELRRHRWEQIAVNSFDLLLGAHWDHDIIHRQRPNYKSNDEVDRWRAAVALVYSDIFITDSYVTELCRKAKTNDYSATVVFSAKRPKPILECLQNRCS